MAEVNPHYQFLSLLNDQLSTQIGTNLVGTVPDPPNLVSYEIQKV